MKITKIGLERFKKIHEVVIDLAPINILVGGNNSGKSSVLQGIHFSVVAAVAARIADTKTFTQDSLLYCPSRDFVSLRNALPYKNQSNFGYLRIFADEIDEDRNNKLSYKIKIYRGRNEGNVGCEISGSPALRQAVTSSETPFSIYVPGLAGISQVEEYRTESIVRRGVASGDANLYLRNVLYLIHQKGRLDELTTLMKVIFPRLYISVSFNPKKDVYIDVKVSLTGPWGKNIPLELIGTGVQQALQIFSYVTLFHPVLLLLDEPDSHLHPDNQGLLVNALLEIAAETNTNIIMSTHSRHIVDALYEESNVVWLKEGKVYEQGDSIGRIPLLMDIGALDSFDRLREGAIAWVILTEDASFDFIASIANGSGYNPNEMVIYSYKTSTNIQSAMLLADFINEIAPNTNVIIHRDRDFMEDNEVGWVSEKIEESGAIPFITESSDIETYFISKEHISALLHEDEEDIDGWLADIATENHNELMHKFTRKRDDLKHLYRKKEEDPPETLNLIGNDNPLPANKRQGKFMLRKVRAGMHEKYGRTVELLDITAALVSPRLVEIREGVDA